MKNILTLILCFLTLFFTASAQDKSNETISRQISALKADKNITLEYNQAGNSTKLLAIAENFSNRDADRSGLMAMNFAAGFFYAGNALQKSPDRILITFWVMSRKPRFAETHDLRILAGQNTLEIGSGRYSARARENMEYLNFEISRDDLAAIARESSVRMVLGLNEFTFTRGQLKTFADLLILSDVGPANPDN